ncbi:hypothetical protein XENOCAPTIV_005376 [Xenoophorus captivus]|uniref:Uncharacterized protein n=1 Tax=Xenoophorus captivus TaxID=1517983 RepID=A0ABV0SG56_9TELE
MTQVNRLEQSRKAGAEYNRRKNISSWIIHNDAAQEPPACFKRLEQRASVCYTGKHAAPGQLLFSLSPQEAPPSGVDDFPHSPWPKMLLCGFAPVLRNLQPQDWVTVPPATHPGAAGAAENKKKV